MKKSDALAWGVAEQHLKEFQKTYWADVRISARQLAEKEKSPKAEEIRHAIISMIQIMPDLDKLQKVLATVNRLYYKMRQEADAEREQRIIETIEQFTEAAVNEEKQADEVTPPEAVQNKEGGVECQ